MTMNYYVQLFLLTFFRVDAKSSTIDEESLQPRLVNVKDFKCVDLSKEQVLLTVVSTAGDGRCNKRAFIQKSGICVHYDSLST